MTTLMIDNYDSFTWNVYQALSALGADVHVVRNDQITVEACLALNPRNVVISPGPGAPRGAGVSNDVIRAFAGKVPILGVCLGEQCMFELYGGVVNHVGTIVHGKASAIDHDGRGLYAGVDQGILCTRYHSLAGDAATLPDCLEITSRTRDGIVMGVRHREYAMEGVQFHPESVISEQGTRLFANFLSWQGGTWATLTRDPSYLATATVAKAAATTSKTTATAATATAAKSTAAAVATPAKNDSILERIKAQRLKDVAALRALPGRSFAALYRSLTTGVVAPPQKDVLAHLQACRARAPVAFFAEIKRASPSKQAIDLSAHAPTIALQYAQAGVAAISVLTEPTWFKGRLEDMTHVRAALEPFGERRPLVLRKDFIVDPYQILESRLAGADLILLIVAILSADELAQYMAYARALGMEPLVEVANAAEMQTALDAGAQLIGINNRDLHTFTVADRVSPLLSMVPPGVLVLALSGIQTHEDVQRYMQAGCCGVLVGETLMRSANVADTLRQLVRGPADAAEPAADASAARPAAAGPEAAGAMAVDALRAPPPSRPFVKLCGLTNALDYAMVRDVGADAAGFILVPDSKRAVTLDAVVALVEAAEGPRAAWAAAPTWAPTPPPAEARTAGRMLRHFAQQLRALRAALGAPPLRVAVLKDATDADVAALAAAPRGLFHAVQLHGGATPDRVAAIARRLPHLAVIKVLHVPRLDAPAPNAAAADLRDALVAELARDVDAYARHGAHAVLLDTAVPVLPGAASGASASVRASGGAGVPFDWSLVPRVAAACDGAPLLVAGGLGPANVAAALAQTGAAALGVDASSGVERAPGAKCVSRVLAYMAAVRGMAPLDLSAAPLGEKRSRCD